MQTADPYREPVNQFEAAARAAVEAHVARIAAGEAAWAAALEEGQRSLDEFREAILPAVCYLTIADTSTPAELSDARHHKVAIRFKAATMTYVIDDLSWKVGGLGWNVNDERCGDDGTLATMLLARTRYVGFGEKLANAQDYARRELLQPISPAAAAPTVAPPQKRSGSRVVTVLRLCTLGFIGFGLAAFCDARCADDATTSAAPSDGAP